MNSETILPTQTVYISNINTKVNKLELKKSLYALMSQFGQILDIVTLKTPKMRGQAFVVFKEMPSATQAIRVMQNYPFYDKPIKIGYAKTKSQAVSQFEATAGIKSGRGMDSSAVPSIAPQQAASDDMEIESAQAVANTEPNRILFVENLPTESTSSMLTILFQQYPGFKEARLVSGRSDIAFVEFDNITQALVAQSVLNNFRIDATHNLRISFAKK